MDVNVLITEAKARFSHNSAKAYLYDKYNSQLLVASQNGLWKADASTISLLSALDSDETVLMDTFNNPIKVNRKLLLNELKDIYSNVMLAWHQEWIELEGKR